MNGLKERLSSTAFIFRGYNVTNLGRSGELLAHPLYGPVIEPFLKEAREVCAEATGGRSIWRPEFATARKPIWTLMPKPISLIVAMEMAQLRLLKDFFGVDYSQARLAFGYSLGETRGARGRRRDGNAACPARAALGGARLRRIGPRYDAGRALLRGPGPGCRCRLSGSACGSIRRDKE